MTPLIPPQPPRLPDPGQEYTRGYFDALLNVFRLYFNRLSNALNVLFGPLGASSLEAPYALLMNTVSQTNAGPTVANVVPYNQSVLARGVEVRSGNQIWFDMPGQYQVSVELQLSNRSNATQEVDVWVREDGTNYPFSNLKYDVPPRKSASVWGHTVVSFSGIFTVTDPETKYMSVVWHSGSTDIFLEAYPAAVSPTRPETPSAVVTVSMVSRLPTTP